MKITFFFVFLIFLCSGGKCNESENSDQNVPYLYDPDKIDDAKDTVDFLEAFKSNLLNNLNDSEKKLDMPPEDKPEFHNKEQEETKLLSMKPEKKTSKLSDNLQINDTLSDIPLTFGGSNTDNENESALGDKQESEISQKKENEGENIQIQKGNNHNVVDNTEIGEKNQKKKLLNKSNLEKKKIHKAGKSEVKKKEKKSLVDILNQSENSYKNIAYEVESNGNVDHNSGTSEKFDEMSDISANAFQGNENETENVILNKDETNGEEKAEDNEEKEGEKPDLMAYEGKGVIVDDVLMSNDFVIEKSENGKTIKNQKEERTNEKQVRKAKLEQKRLEAKGKQKERKQRNVESRGKLEKKKEELKKEFYIKKYHDEGSQKKKRDARKESPKKNKENIGGKNDKMAQKLKKNEENFDYVDDEEKEGENEPKLTGNSNDTESNDFPMYDASASTSTSTSPTLPSSFFAEKVSLSLEDDFLYKKAMKAISLNTSLSQYIGVKASLEPENSDVSWRPNVVNSLSAFFLLFNENVSNRIENEKDPNIKKSIFRFWLKHIIIQQMMINNALTGSTSKEAWDNLVETFSNNSIPISQSVSEMQQLYNNTSKSS